MEYGPGSICPVIDSVSQCGSIFMSFTPDVFVADSSSVNGVCPDTVGVAFVNIFSPLPPGKYKCAEVWFSGAIAGQQVLTDSASLLSGWTFTFHSGGGGFPYTLRFVG